MWLSIVFYPFLKSKSPTLVQKVFKALKPVSKAKEKFGSSICTYIENVKVLYILHSTLVQGTEMLVFAAEGESFKIKKNSESTSGQNGTSWLFQTTGEVLQTSSIRSQLLIFYNEYKRVSKASPAKLCIFNPATGWEAEPQQCRHLQDYWDPSQHTFRVRCNGT